MMPSAPQSAAEDVHLRVVGQADLLRTVDGVASATVMNDEIHSCLTTFFTSSIPSCLPLPSEPCVQPDQPANSATVKQWLHWIATWSDMRPEPYTRDALWLFDDSELRRSIAKLCLGLCILRQVASEDPTPESRAANLAVAWDMIRHAIVSSLTSPDLHFRLYRSYRGFDELSLCSIMKGGEIEQLFRLHMWIPTGDDPTDLPMHSEIAFAHSWVILGQAKLNKCSLENCEGSSHAPFMVYGARWHNGRNQDNPYRKATTSTSIVDLNRRVRIAEVTSIEHSRGTTFTIPPGVYHKIQPSGHTLFATLTFVDANRGKSGDVTVLRPSKDDTPWPRDYLDTTALTDVMTWVYSLTRWEQLMASAREHTRTGSWEQAVQIYEAASNICSKTSNFPAIPHYQRRVAVFMARVLRRYGQTERSEALLEDNIDHLPQGRERMSAAGQLAAILRHKGRLVDAKIRYEIQYNTAHQLGLIDEQCKAAGNLGMVNYQLYLKERNAELLQLATKQLQQRITQSRVLAQQASTTSIDSKRLAKQLQRFRKWEAFGLSRLSLCIAAAGDAYEAEYVSKAALDLIRNDPSPVQAGVCRYFYGRALLLAGRRDEALAVFNSHDGCPPAVALCRERSAERLEYLQQMADVGTDFSLRDQQGYDALDYTAINDDQEAEKVVLKGLLTTYDSQGQATEKVQQRHQESQTRKLFREIFQERLRPVLQGSLLSHDHTNVFHHVRLAYAKAREQNEHKKDIFDELRYITYDDFKARGKLPEWTESLTRSFTSTQTDTTPAQFIVFFSYRWLYDAGDTSSGPGEASLQYTRMLDAVEQFLKQHRDVDPRTLGIWLDRACINQSNIAPGVAALPMILAQCDAVISLVDDFYYDRAWCSVEVMLAQTLRRSYRLHEWYEHKPVLDQNGRHSWTLTDGPLNKIVEISGKQVTYEEDRAKIAFLERQSKLLGQFQPD